MLQVNECDSACTSPRTALVTGASGVIGGAICELLAKRGFVVVGGFSRQGERADALRTRIELAGGRFVPLHGDLSGGAAACTAFFDAARAEAGEPQVFVGAAGVTSRETVLGTRAQDAARLLEINVLSAIELARRAMRAMMRANFGRIILVGSRAGQVGMPGQAVYAASKAALAGWVRSAAGEVGHRSITVNLLAPGAIEEGENRTVYSTEERQRVTEMIGCRRLGRPEEVAEVAAFLVSTGASYINGAVIAVDGGARF